MKIVEFVIFVKKHGKSKASSTTLSKAYRLFEEGFHENKEGAIDALRYTYAMRTGLGIRNFYEYIITQMSQRPEYQGVVLKLLYETPREGRWSSVIKIAENASPRVASAAFKMIQDALTADVELCKKWLPRQGRMASRIRGYLKVMPKEYREMLKTTK